MVAKLKLVKKSSRLLYFYLFLIRLFVTFRQTTIKIYRYLSHLTEIVLQIPYNLRCVLTPTWLGLQPHLYVFFQLDLRPRSPILFSLYRIPNNLASVSVRSRFTPVILNFVGNTMKNTIRIFV